jgi:predicted DNA-binding transcriptional regulator YafY
VSKERLLYLVATLWDYNDPVLLLPHRINSAILLETVVTPPAGFSLDVYLASGEMQFAKSSRTLRIDVLFSSEAGSHLLETPLSDDQQVKEVKDGRLRIKATVQDTRQLRWWLLGFGNAVEVLAPKGLRTEFSVIAAGMDGIYSRR